MVDFLKIDYLKVGNERQKAAHQLLIYHQIFKKLQDFDPILTGTIPINIDTTASDLDIICYWTNKVDFINSINQAFANELNFILREVLINDEQTVIANFWLDDFELEIFGQHIPTKSQNAYKHMVIEYQILQKKGEDFRQQVIDLKNQGFKTEPAFAKLLNLAGDPYISLLNY